MAHSPLLTAADRDGDGATRQAVSCDVLIVGLGPVGATLTALLADAGVDTLAIESSDAIYPLPRAAHFDHEVMRVFQQLGIAGEVLKHARPATGYEFRTATGEVLVSFGHMGTALSASGWPEAFMFNQPGLERALRAKLDACSNVRIRLETKFDSWHIRGDGIAIAVTDCDGPLRIYARYVIGCDGARSMVREAMGSTLEDYRFDEPWLVIDATPRPGCRLPEINLQICDPARPTTCVHMGPGRHRWEFMLLPGETVEQVLEDSFIASLLAKWHVDIDIERKTVYRFHGLVADHWRNGPVFIAGDAAHQTPPFAGQGMCAGIRDAANIAWKLAAVLRGQAAPSILDSYQIEREPNVRAYITLAIEMGRVVCTLDPEVARQRDMQLLEARKAGINALPPASPPPLIGPCILATTPGAGTAFPQPVTSALEHPLRLDDVLGAGPWLLTRSHTDLTDVATLRVVSLNDPRVAPFRSALLDWLTERQVDAVLIRPDRYVFGTGEPDRLARAWSDALTPPLTQPRAVA